MDSMEAKVNESEIERDLKLGLLNAENTSEKDSAPQTGNLDALKPKCQLNDTSVRLLLDFKNRYEAKLLSKDLDDDAKKFISDYLKTTPEEIKVWRTALEQTGDRYLPSEYIEWILKYLNSPIFILIESEIQKISGLKGALEKFHSEKKGVA